jgi:4-methyl-5(b-hydroxyethyl)-thiazole monophosphate biosynthesis
MRRAKNLYKVLVPIANGSEEIETVTIIDTLVRAGAEVILASVETNLRVRTRETTLVNPDDHLR